MRKETSNVLTFFLFLLGIPLIVVSGVMYAYDNLRQELTEELDTYFLRNWQILGDLEDDGGDSHGR